VNCRLIETPSGNCDNLLGDVTLTAFRVNAHVEVPYTECMALPRLKLLATGGTIASRYKPEVGGVMPSMSPQSLIASVPGLAAIAHIEVEQIAMVHGADMTPDVWLRLAGRAALVLDEEDTAGVLVTHGTDTLEETAYFLDLTIAHDKPVVFTGAQRAASFFDTDGPRNLLDSARVAATPESRGMGVMVVLNGQIHAARDVSKTNTLRVETFQSPDTGPLGFVEMDGVRYYRKPLCREHFPLPAMLPRVEIVMHYAGADGALIRALIGKVDGLVIAATGAGNVNAEMHAAIAEAISVGVRVVVASRVPSGRVTPIYAGPGKGIDLERIGCEFADNLSPQKARVRLMLQLRRTAPLKITLRAGRRAAD
jgi:L-asparaginase